MTIDKKPWYKSKTKWASVLIGGGAILTTVGGILSGSVDFVNGAKALAVEAGVILAIFGVRDLPFVNRK